jgi:hemolysin activation/secretion protein
MRINRQKQVLIIALAFLLINHPVLALNEPFLVPVASTVKQETRKIKQIKVIGSTVFEETEIQAITEPFINQEITLIFLEEM